MEKNEIKIIYKKTSELCSYQNNPRQHSIEQISQIAKSISEFGFTNPIILGRDNTVIAGHGRLYAARHIEMDLVPCVELTHLTETQNRAYVIADNKISLNSTWDFDALKEELDKLSEADFDISFIGLEDFGEIQDIDKESKQTSQDTTPQEIKSKFSLIVDCEDEADQEAVFKLMTSKGYSCKVLSI